MRLATVLQAIALSTALLTGSLTSTALAVSTTNTVVWNGLSSFNDAAITFNGFLADQLSDIKGSGQYEACCWTGKTSFTLELYFNGGWQTVHTWKTKGDEDTKLLDKLVPSVIAFSDKPVTVSGIKLTSSPDGSPWSDFNFTNLIGIMSRHEFFEKYRWKYRDWWHFNECDDYEQYVIKVTKFIFDCKHCSDDPHTNPLPTPLPAALPLMGSVLGGCGFALWRRRRKKSA